MRKRNLKQYAFYADKLMDDGAPHAQADHITSTDNGYVDIVKRHAQQMVADGYSYMWFVRVERDGQSTLWAHQDTTRTIDERYVSAKSAA